MKVFFFLQIFDTKRNQSARRLNRVIKDISDVLAKFLGQFNAIWTVSFNTFNKYFLDSNQADLVKYFDFFFFFTLFLKGT